MLGEYGKNLEIRSVAPKNALFIGAVAPRTHAIGHKDRAHAEAGLFMPGNRRLNLLHSCLQCMPGLGVGSSLKFPEMMHGREPD